MGVDGQSGLEYGEELESKLDSLLRRAHTGSYRAPPVRRVEIPKGDGSKTRPIGIPTYEDKVLQCGVVMLLEPIYEEEFYDFSYGFRPGRSAHDALSQLHQDLWRRGGGWVLDVDIRSFFDTINHDQLRHLVSQRVHDGVVLRLIGKWLRAGVLEDGSVHHPECGSPQGGVISPLLSNIYLHEVIDRWWSEQVLPRLRGPASLVRYADDLVMAFSVQSDAERVHRVLPHRLARYGLSLHPEKTRLVDFRRPSDTGSRPGSFSFLGFTHYWGRSRRGAWMPMRKTAKERFNRGLRSLNRWMRAARHVPLEKQAKTLGRKLAGHFNDYGIAGNSRSITSFAYRARCRWRKWLSRRSQHGRLTWEKFHRLLLRYPLPPARLRSRSRPVVSAKL